MEYVSIVLKFGQLVSVENNNDNAFTICLWCNSDIKSWSLVLWRELCLTIAYKMFVNYLVLLSFAVNKYRTQTSHYVRNKLKKAILLGFNTRCCISHHIDSILVVLVLNKMLFFCKYLASNVESILSGWLWIPNSFYTRSNWTRQRQLILQEIPSLTATRNS